MNLKRTLYYWLKRPTYPEITMKPEDFGHLDKMFERQVIAGALIAKLESKRILDIGCGFLPIYKYMDESAYEMITCVDPVIETDDSNAKVKCYKLGIENLEHSNSYDTIILLGLAHIMGKGAYEAIDTILESSNVKNFILEHFVCRLLSIYVNRITKNLPKLGYRKKIFFSIEYPNNPLYDRREMEIWIR